MRNKIKENLKFGVLDIIILKVISDSPSYGWDIKKTIEEKSAGFINIPGGSLYMPLRRLEEKGFVTSNIEVFQGKRYKKIYNITPQGQEWLEIAKEAFYEVQKGANFIFR